jgi:lysophospholipase L1-like esterase
MSDQQTSEPQPVPPERRSRWLGRIGILLIVLALLLIGLELFARFYLGLGDPPLMVADPQIEYLNKPDQTVHRFGHIIHYNAYSMRSEDFPAHKSDPNELRVLMIGDSVINGGAVLRDDQIVSSILKSHLSEDLHRPVVIGNVSAGSWGPPNEIAYLKRFGTFDADIVVLVLSSHDITDVPTFQPIVGIDPAFPDHKPLFALSEVKQKYLPRLWYQLTHRAELAQLSAPATGPTTLPADAVEQCSAAIRQIIEIARSAGAKVIVAQHLESAELNRHEQPGYFIISRLLHDEHIDPVEFGPAFRKAENSAQHVYDGNIHPNAAGHQLMAQVLLPAIEREAQ